jgi:hypothetical protein
MNIEQVEADLAEHTLLGDLADGPPIALLYENRDLNTFAGRVS